MIIISDIPRIIARKEYLNLKITPGVNMKSKLTLSN